MADISQLTQTATTEINDAADLKALDALRVKYLGKKGLLTEQMKTLGNMAPEERKAFGQAINVAKDALTALITERETNLADAELTARLANETLDITLPVREERQGTVHPVSYVIEEITAIFADFGMAVAEGPDIEDDFHNFTALNFPESHPAREMHDTFYMNGERDGKKLLLRTHTSPVQIRTMLRDKPPIRILAPGTTYRSDSDMTHTPMFHQVEGLVIEKNVHFGHLKGLIADFLRAFFEIDDVKLRFRPSFFPFTEPSAEVDIGCKRSASELVIGAGDDWLEIMGCGMVHPNVLRHCGLDPEEWQGFAFGMGVERLAMLKYNIPDLRTFFESDVRWLKHYGFKPSLVPSLIGGLS